MVEGARLESDLSARADAHHIPPTPFRSTTFRNNDVRLRVSVNCGVEQGFRGVSDTVLTQPPKIRYDEIRPRTSHVSPTRRAPLRKSVWPSPSKGNAVKKSAKR
jgi:hypothetical protein